MPEISAAAVSSLRSRTGVSILQCKKALEDAGGDEEKAIEILRSSGAAQAVKKAGRDQTEGAIFVAHGGGKAAMLVLACETDFVARNDDFIVFGQELADLYLKDGDAAKEAIEAKFPDAVQRLGENISLGEMHFIEASTLGCYVHSNRKIGVIVGLDGSSEDIAKDVAMHAAAMDPQYVSPDDAPQADIDSEKEIWKKQLAEEGKPAEIMEKIMMGKEKKFREENALLTQDFVKEPGTMIKDLLAGASVTHFVRASIG